MKGFKNPLGKFSGMKNPVEKKSNGKFEEVIGKKKNIKRVIG